MKILTDFNMTVDAADVADRLNHIRKSVPLPEDKEILRKIFSMIDLTTLSERDNIRNVSEMCNKLNMLSEAYPSMPAVAAVCVYPELVSVVKEALDNPLVNMRRLAEGSLPPRPTRTSRSWRSNRPSARVPRRSIS